MSARAARVGQPAELVFEASGLECLDSGRRALRANMSGFVPRSKKKARENCHVARPQYKDK